MNRLPRFTVPGGLAETNVASSHSPKRSRVVRTFDIRSGEADVTAAGQTLTITPLTMPTEAKRPFPAKSCQSQPSGPPWPVVENSEASGSAAGDTISAPRAVWQTLLVGWQDVAASDEVEAANWIHGRLHPFAQDVGSVVPTGFGAYARIFHPARGAHPLEVEVRWSEVAARSGKTVHPEMQFHTIAVPARDRAHAPEAPIHEPRLGVLSDGQAGALVQLLSKHTATPDACWLCLWEGYGDLNPGATAWLTATSPGSRPKPPGFGFGRLRFGMPKTATRGFPERKRVTLPGRDYVFFKGSVAAAQGWEDGPNLWWPDDQAWCVASEIDFPYTYVGGTSELIDEILQDPALEALPATVAHGISATSDTINSFS